MAGKTLPVGFFLRKKTRGFYTVFGNLKWLWRQGHVELVPSGIFKTFSENYPRTLYCCIFFKNVTKKLYIFSGSQKFFWFSREREMESIIMQLLAIVGRNLLTPKWDRVNVQGIVTSGDYILMGSVLMLEVEIANRFSSMSIVINYMYFYLAVSRESLNWCLCHFYEEPLFRLKQ